MIAWKAGPDGEVMDANSAPDGDIYIAAALLVAHGHWCVSTCTQLGRFHGLVGVHAVHQS